MKKTLIAEKVKDGYLVKIITTIHVGCEDEVKKIIRYEGLKKTPFNPDEVDIYAD